ncbi:MAG: type II toxin-antitoxin system RelE/ParE family toxin [Granulicella sp.]
MSSAKSTAYHVELAERAMLDLESIYAEIDAENSPAALRWYVGLEEIIFSLDQLPDRGTRTEEDRKLRQLLYGSKPHIYRIIYSINRPAKQVTVVHIRHGARNSFQ